MTLGIDILTGVLRIAPFFFDARGMLQHIDYSQCETAGQNCSMNQCPFSPNPAAEPA